MVGFEPTASRVRGEHSDQTELHPVATPQPAGWMSTWTSGGVSYAARDSNPRPRSKSPVLMPTQLAAHTVRSPAWNRTKIVRVTTACSAVELRGNEIVRAPGRIRTCTPRKDLGYNQASRPTAQPTQKCRQCRESNPKPRRLRRPFSSPEPCLVRRILTGGGQPASDAVADDVPTICGRLPRGFHRRVGVTGVEPATLRSQSGCATKLRHTPMLPSHVLASRHAPVSHAGPSDFDGACRGLRVSALRVALLAQAQY